MTIAFIRTYNNKQNSEVQEAVIREFAESQKIEIGKWAKEVGNSPRANRRLESIVKSLSPKDEILVSDISRVSRKMIEIIHIILLCIERKVTLRSVSDGYVFEIISTVRLWPLPSVWSPRSSESWSLSVRRKPLP